VGGRSRAGGQGPAWPRHEERRGGGDEDQGRSSGPTDPSPSWSARGRDALNGKYVTHRQRSRRRAARRHADLVRAGVTRPELQSGTETLLAFDVRSFRTTFATWCARSRFDSADLDKWLGHKPKTTAAKHYVKDTGAMTSGVFPAVPARFSQRPMARRSRARDPPFAHPVDQAPDSPMITVRRKGLEARCRRSRNVT